VEFTGSDLNDATVGLKDVQVQDKMKATVSYHVASQVRTHPTTKIVIADGSAGIHVSE
jgi:hypothetical protein